MLWRMSGTENDGRALMTAKIGGEVVDDARWRQQTRTGQARARNYNSEVSGRDRAEGKGRIASKDSMTPHIPPCPSYI